MSGQTILSKLLGIGSTVDCLLERAVSQTVKLQERGQALEVSERILSCLLALLVLALLVKKSVNSLAVCSDSTGCNLLYATKN